MKTVECCQNLRTCFVVPLQSPHVGAPRIQHHKVVSTNRIVRLCPVGRARGVEATILLENEQLLTSRRHRAEISN
jgi:hypothetical protein